MKIEGIIWLTEIVEKLAFKHDVEPDEVEEVFENKPKIRFVEKGERKGENVFGTNSCGQILVRTFHLQENERSIDPECERHGRQGKKAIWQKVNPQPCQSLIRSMNSWVSLIPMTWASTGSECPKRLLT